MHKYEISVWDDVFDANSNSFKEQKVIVIGSNTMTSESRAREPKMVNNINGTTKFSFNLYYQYIDTMTGELIKNPYVKYLVNERKIKVFWKDKWYDLLVKQIKEDQVNHVFSYTCEDAFITELSRTGFNLTFSTELQNNIGTAKELINKVLNETDWRLSLDSDVIYQETEEPVYETTVVKQFSAKKNPSDTATNILKDKPILVFYSSAPDANSLPTTVQFYYTGGGFQQDKNDMLVINGTSYTVDVTWKVSNGVANAQISGSTIFSINLNTGLSTNYRAKRYVQTQKTVYNSILDRYVNVYNNGALLGYETTEYDDALAVVNLITNPSNFSNASGWTGENLTFKLYPAFDENTRISDYKATSYLQMKKGTYFNSGIQNNRPYIPNGFTVGETYIFRVKMKSSLSGNYLANTLLVTPSIESRTNKYAPSGTKYFNITTKTVNSQWLEYKMTCCKSVPYDMIISAKAPFGIFLTCNNGDYWLQEAQFFKEVYGLDGNNVRVRIEPGQMSKQSLAQSVWKYFDATQASNITKDTLVYKQISLTPWASAKPDYTNYEKYGTIEESHSNRFNILQSIAEAFECWVLLDVQHDDAGYITYDSNNRINKFIKLTRQSGQETGIGFRYGIDLKSIGRNVKSDKISTKIIVEQNNNEHGKDGFCTIARSEQNYPRESFILNFDYYIQQGLLDKNALYQDLYKTGGIAYYSQLHTYNVNYAKNIEALTNKQTELIKQKATSTVYSQYIQASTEELQNTKDTLMKLAGVNKYTDVNTYAASHKNDTKVASLINDVAFLQNNINEYDTLKQEIDTSISKLEAYITSVEAQQKTILTNLTALNKRFNTKYARFIQEGSWISDEYWNDDLYYLDALQVAYTSSKPQVSYDINVLRLSDLEDYSSKVFQLGDISFVEDTEYFGYLEDKITPYKEKVVLTEITSYFESPEKDLIKVQNYKTQFDDLFQRITATVQSLELSEGKYIKAADIINSDGTIKSNVIQNTFINNQDLVYGAQNESAVIDNTGITVTDKGNAANKVKVTSGGIFVTNDGGATWKNAIRGDGISTELLTAGRIDAEQITIYSGDYPSFRWDANGLNAYQFDSSGKVNTKNFIRMDQYGLYGMQNAPEVYVPASELDIYQNAKFGLTWNRFFMKNSSGNRSIEISTDRDIIVSADGIERVAIGRVDGSSSTNYGIKIRNQSNDTIFQCDNNGSYISGWTLTKNALESTKTGKDKNYYTSLINTTQGGKLAIFANGIERVTVGVTDTASNSYGIRIKDGSSNLIFKCDTTGSILSGWTLTENYIKSKVIGSNNSVATLYADGKLVFSSNNKDRVTIGALTTSNYGINIIDNNDNIIFKCDSTGSELSGWKLTEDYLESVASSENSNIRIYSNGNIGCYAREASTQTEKVYTVTVKNSFTGKGLNVSGTRTFTQNQTVYPFVNTVGKTKTQRQIGGDYDSKYDTPPADYIPSPPSKIQIAFTIGSLTYNYTVENIAWVVSHNPTTHKTETITDAKGNTSKLTVYTYTFNLTAKINNTIIFEIPYIADPSTEKNRYIPASDTKWYIDNKGDAVFHNILADGGQIAGWFIDGFSIYQTKDGTSARLKLDPVTNKWVNNVKTELSSTGTAVGKDGFDYDIIVEALNASMASLGGVLMQSGLINGYNIAEVAGLASSAYSLASSAESKAADAASAASQAQTTAKVAKSRADGAWDRAEGHGHTVSNSDGTYGWTTGVV